MLGRMTTLTEASAARRRQTWSAAEDHTVDVAEFVADLQEQGYDPVVGVEATSGGDVFIVTVGDEDPPGDLSPAAR